MAILKICHSTQVATMVKMITNENIWVTVGKWFFKLWVFIGIHLSSSGLFISNLVIPF